MKGMVSHHYYYRSHYPSPLTMHWLVIEYSHYYSYCNQRIWDWVWEHDQNDEVGRSNNSQ